MSLARLRKICLSLPDAHEVEAWGEPTFRLNNKLFAMYASASTHHGAGRPSVWVKSTGVNQSLMMSLKPNVFFSPPYVGPSGWIGIWLDGKVDWSEVREVIRDGYDLLPKPRGERTNAVTAPKRGATAAAASGRKRKPAKRASTQRGQTLSRGLRSGKRRKGSSSTR